MQGLYSVFDRVIIRLQNTTVADVRNNWRGPGKAFIRLLQVSGVDAAWQWQGCLRGF